MDLRNNPVVNRIPYANAVRGLNRQKFGNIEDKNKSMTECIICMENYKDTDEIAVLDCDQKHYFHAKCLEDWLHRKLECPLCKRIIKS